MDVKIFLEGQDISKDLEPFLTSVTYSDKLNGESDVLEVALMDKEHLLIDNPPPRGSAINISIAGFDLGSFASNR